MIKPIKRLGQNFLRDPNTARKIVDALHAETDAAVVEIGPGTGALTGLLASRHSSVIAVEIDSRAASVIRDQHPGVQVLEQDVLTLDWHALASEKGGPFAVIGNLPYYITSQILFGLLAAADVLSEAVIMMQYEVAARLVARPSTKAYGILSVLTQLGSDPELLFPVSRNVFVPKPDVRSAVVRLGFGAGTGYVKGVGRHPVDLEPRGASTALSHEEFERVRRVVRTAFNQRRKMLSNALSVLTNELDVALPPETATRRAEELSPGEFVDLTRYLHGA